MKALTIVISCSAEGQIGLKFESPVGEPVSKVDVIGCMELAKHALLSQGQPRTEAGPGILLARGVPAMNGPR